MNQCLSFLYGNLLVLFVADGIWPIGWCGKKYIFSFKGPTVSENRLMLELFCPLRIQFHDDIGYQNG